VKEKKRRRRRMRRKHQFLQSLLASKQPSENHRPLAAGQSHIFRRTGIHGHFAHFYICQNYALYFVFIKYYL
jgi:hypothetical protein